MSEKEGAVSDEGSVPPKEVKGSSNKKAASKNKKVPEKSSKKESTPVEEPEESTSSSQENETDKSKPKKKENENDKSTPRKKKSYYVEVEEDDKRAIPLLDQPTVVEGSRQRKKVIPDYIKPETLKVGSIPIPKGRGFALSRIPTVVNRFRRLRLDEIKTLHRFMFGKLGDVNYLNNNILSFNGFAFTEDSPEYAKKLVLLGKMKMSILREFLLLFDLDLKIRKKEDVIKAVLDFLLCPQRSERTQNPNIVSHPKRRATKRNYYEREIEDDERKPKKTKQTKAKENEAAKEAGESSADESASKGPEEEKKSKDEESKENNSGADNTNELKKPAKKRKRNQVIEEQAESAEEGKSKKGKAKETNGESAISDDLEDEVDTSENLSDDELRNFLKKVLADANLEKTTMKTVYALISKHYPNYNFSKKKDFIKEVVKSAIQT